MIVMTSDRAKKATFSIPYVVDQMTFMIATQYAFEVDTNSKFSSGLATFYTSILIMLLITLLMAVIIRNVFRENHLSSTNFKPIWTLFQNFMSKDVCDAEQPTLRGFRLLTIVWSLVGLLTTSIVGCALINLLSESPRIPISTLDQLVKSDLKVTTRGKALKHLVRKSQSSQVKALAKRFYQLNRNEHKSLFESVLMRKPIAYLGLHYSTLSCPRKKFNPSAFYLPESSMFNTLYTISLAAVFQKRSHLAPYFNRV